MVCPVAVGILYVHVYIMLRYCQLQINFVVSFQVLSNEDQVPDHNELYDDDYVSVEPSSVTDLQLSSSCLLLQHHKDFIRCLPVHLSKLILSYLDKASLVNCLCISKHWRMLCEEVQQDVFVHQIMMEEVMMMQV